MLARIPFIFNWTFCARITFIVLYVLGSCPENGHVCSNGRCIKKTFACNGYNSCGDGSECDPADMSTSSIVGIVVGCAVAIAFAIGIVVVLCWIKRVRRVSKRVCIA